MTVLPSSTIGPNGFDNDVLEITVDNESVFVRDFVYLVADGLSSDAIEVSSNANTLLVAGALVADEGNAIYLIGSYNEVAISPTGNLVSGTDAIYSNAGTGNVITNDGTIVAGANGIEFRENSLVARAMVTNNGSITSLSSAVNLVEGGILNNTGTLSSSAGNGAYFGNYDGSSGYSVLSNSGLMNGENSGALFNGAHVMVTNSGIISGGDGLRFDSLSDDATVSNSGEILGDRNGIYSVAQSGSFINTGTITGGGRGIWFIEGYQEISNSGTITGMLTEGVSGRNHLIVTNSGTITGGAGVVASSSDGTASGIGEQLITNSGTISAWDYDAVFLQGTDAAVVNAENGEITSLVGSAVRLDSTRAQITNAGLMHAHDDHGIDVIGDASGVISITNSETGVITGGFTAGYYAINGGDGVEMVHNTGLIDGDISLGGGADNYYSAGDGAVMGTVYGGAGNDELFGSHAPDYFDGGDGNDDLFSGGGDDFLIGGNGNDEIRAGDGEDTVAGNDGDDVIRGGDDEDRLFGGGDNDTLAGNNGDDYLRGGTGDDFVYGGSGQDDMGGGSGNDYLDGGLGDDIIRGNDDNDTILGGRGEDTLAGQAGDDILVGGADNDRLIAGTGQDTLTGGTGADVFVWTSELESPLLTRDQITDFEDGVDMIDLSDIASGLTFVAAYTGTAGEVRYNDSLGRLYIDVDGDSSSDFAIDVTGAPTIDATDLIL